jgi:hypothetical protein
VDRALEVVDEYHRRIEKVERKVLIKPKVSTVRERGSLSSLSYVSFADCDISACPLWRFDSAQTYNGSDKDACIWSSQVRY